MAKRMQWLSFATMGRETIYLGYAGENEHTRININCNEIYRDYPEAVTVLVVQPPSGDLYLAYITVESGSVIWDVADADVVTSGSGRCQLCFDAGGELIRSAIASTSISDSIEPTGSAQDPAEAWSDAAIRALMERDGVVRETVNEMLPTVVEDVTEEMTNSAQLMARFAVNLADIEESVAEMDEVAERAEDITEDLETAMSEIDAILESSQLSRWSRLNRPNLLTQNFWTNWDMPNGTVVYDLHTIAAEDATAAAEVITYTITDENITSSYKRISCISSDYENVSTSLVSVTCAEGSATVTIAARTAHAAQVTIKIWLCTTAATDVVYGEYSKIRGSSTPYMDSIGTPQYPGDDSTDGVSVSVATLTGDDIITDADGEVYNKAIQYAIVANSAYGNTEDLYYPDGLYKRQYAVGGTCDERGEINEMEVGGTYTVSCWARVLSGDGAYLRFGWGGSNHNPMGTPQGKAGASDYIEVTGTAWQRVHWTFVFEPTGDYYTETTEDGTVIRIYNWNKRVVFGVARKYTATLQLCGFRLVKGELEMNTRYDELKEMLRALEKRVAALEG